MQIKQSALTPQSVCAEPSPLDEARAEIAQLHKEINRLKQRPLKQIDARILDLQLRSTAYRKFIIKCGTYEEFREQNPQFN